MADARFRQLERRFGETGAQDDEVALLKARLRAGVITHTNLEVAAYLRDAASLELLGADAPPEEKTFRGWASGLESLGPEVSMRAAIAAARRAYGVVARFYRVGDPGHPLLAVEAAEVSVACPCLEHIQELLVVARRTEAASRGPNAIQLGSGPAAAAQACLATALLVDSASRHPSVRAQRSWWGPEHARLALCDEIADENRGDDPTETIDLTESLLGEAGRRIRDAVREELVPWALAHGDPVRSRVLASGIELQGPRA